MTPRTCALCGERDAATLTDLDGRAVPACTRCLAPVPDPAHPYAACTGPHGLRHCDTQRAVALLTSAGLVMSAREVQDRIEAKRGGAA